MKESKTKIQTKMFRLLLGISFTIYITTYISNKYGYYEYKKHEQATLTQEQIKKFEQDVKAGKDISLEDYLLNTDKNYQTKLSGVGLKISNGISDVVKVSVEKFFNSINEVVTESNS